jgi:dTDP-4-amino-4,6-dideoxygalactose transaminase
VGFVSPRKPASVDPKDRIPVARPSFGAEEERAVAEVLRSGWVTQGPRVAEFEERFASRVGAAEAVAVTSGTTALFLTLHALGIGRGDEVIVPSLSFIASANAIVHCGAAPVFVDVDPRTYNLAPAAVARAVTPRTRAVMPVHQLGLPADLDAIQEIADREGLKVVEDAACAVGSAYKERPIGSFGNPACFSFHGRKVVVTGEGGMITTEDAQLAARLRRLRHQGMSASDLERHRAERVILEAYPEIGYNFRLSDLQAAVGLVQLDKLDGFLTRRREIAERYREALGDLREIELRSVPEFAQPNHQSVLVRLRGVSAAQRNRVLDAMQQRGIATRRGLMASHRERCHESARTSGPLPHTEAAADQTLILPIYTDLTAEGQARVADAFREVVCEVLGEAPDRSGEALR